MPVTAVRRINDYMQQPVSYIYSVNTADSDIFDLWVDTLYTIMWILIIFASFIDISHLCVVNQ